MGTKDKILTGVVCALATAGIIYSVSTQALLTQHSGKGQNPPVVSLNEGSNSDGKVHYLDGTYEGDAIGFGGALRVSVVIENEKIKSVTVLSHTETPEYYDMASAVIAEIVNRNSTDVDSVSGATITSNAIKEAVYNALKKAEKVVEGGTHTDLNIDEVQPTEEIIDIAASNSEKPSVSGNTHVQTNGLKNGTYIGTGRGWNGPIRVRITVKNHKLANIEVLSHSDDAPYFSQASSVINRILSSGGGNVETVSGATYSSRGIIEAVQDALRQAKGNNTPNQNDAPNNGGQGGGHENGNQNGENQNNGGNGHHGGQGPDAEVNPPTDLEQVYISDVMADGEFVGYGVGYQTAGRIQTTVVVENGEVKSVKVAEQKPEYADDIDIFRARAVRMAEFMTGKNARKVAAVAHLYSSYTNLITQSENPYETATALLGESYAAPIKGLDPHMPYYKREETISGAIKGFLGNKYDTNDVFDAVTGATISASGVGKSVEDAMRKAVNDAKQNNDVKDTIVTAPKDKLIRANKNRPLDLSRLRVTLVKKDNTRVELEAKDFAANGIKMKDIDNGNIITDGMSLENYPVHGLIQVEVMHEASLSNDKFSIDLGEYSNDYVNQIHYSLDGKNWYRVKNPVMSQQTPENISYLNQVIDAPENYMYENVKIRVVSQSGQIYEYKTTKLAGSTRDTLYTVIDARGNSNVPERLYVQFTFSGTEADKELVPNNSETKPPEPTVPNPDTGKEVEVDNNIISTDLNFSKDIDYIEGQPIKPIKVTLHDSKAEPIHVIENLPKGLSFNGTHIVGTPEIDADQWDPDYYGGLHLEIKIRTKARKGNVVLVKTDSIMIRRDQDRDGIADYNESDNDLLVFNAQLTDRDPIVVNGVAPSMQDYTAKIKNLPKKGVQVEILQKPDLSVKGKTQVKLGFSVNGLKKVGEAIIKIDVVTPAPDVPDSLKEVEVDNNVISTDLNFSEDIDYIEGQPIKPIKVTLHDSKAEPIHVIENLPNGLSFNGTHIVGTPEIDADQWDPDYYDGLHLEIKIRTKARKGNVVLVKTDSIIIRRDQDRDGIADYNESDKDLKVFNAVLTNNAPMEVHGKALTLDDYKARIKNLPSKGVTVKILQEPDLSVAGTTSVKLGFYVDGLPGVGEKEIKVTVVEPVAPKQ